MDRRQRPNWGIFKRRFWGLSHRHQQLGGRLFPITFASGAVVAPEGALDSDSGLALQIAAQNGIGIAQLLRCVVEDDLRAGRLRPVLPDEPLPSVPLQALHAFGRFPPLRARLLVDFVAARIAALAAGGPAQTGHASSR